MAKKRATKKKATTRLPKIRFENSWEPLKTPELRKASYTLNIPDEYFEFLKKTNGGDPDHNIFSWQHPKEGRQDATLERLVGIDPLPLTHEQRQQAPDMVSATLIYRDELPKLSVVIGWVDVEEVLLMFWEGRRKGQVWLMIREPAKQSREEGLYLLAKSFREFLGMLSKPPEPEEPPLFALDSPKVRGKQLEATLRKLKCKKYRWPGVMFSKHALPPAWEWPIYKRDGSRDPALLTVERNCKTAGRSLEGECYTDERPPNHKVLVVNVSKQDQSKCLKALVEALGESAVLFS